jgi:hypothetical protein
VAPDLTPTRTSTTTTPAVAETSETVSRL